MAHGAATPDIIIILADDMGFSDIGCFGGEIDTPNLDALAAAGVRFSHFYSTARCCPARASLLTGLHPHQAGVGLMTEDLGLPGYRGELSAACATLPEYLKAARYRSYMAGKWHASRHLVAPRDNWPLLRGFDRFWGTITGAGSYFQPLTLVEDDEPVVYEGGYYTDRISDHAVSFIRDHGERHASLPMFCYVAYTAPHWPLHAPDADVASYRGRYSAGWDRLRAGRLARLRSMGILKEAWPLSDRDPSQPPWEGADHRAWRERRMEVYAAQVTVMDRGIGRIVAELRRLGRLQNTLIVFLSDNGGCAEELHLSWRGPLAAAQMVPERTTDGRPAHYGNDPAVMPGDEATYQSYGVAWANLSNTPFRLYKHWVHEGGTATPFVAHWPAGIGSTGAVVHQPAQLVDIVPTCLELAGLDPRRRPAADAGGPDARHPANRAGPALPGVSIAPAFRGERFGEHALFWEHQGNGAVRRDRWKLVRRHPLSWELYDMEADRTELHDLAATNPGTVAELSALYDAWAARVGVEPWEKVRALHDAHYARYRARG